MVRTVFLVLANVTLALVLAASVMPVAVVLLPVLRAAPGTGLAVFILSAAGFVAMNGLLWRWWKRQ